MKKIAERVLQAFRELFGSDVCFTIGLVSLLVCIIRIVMLVRAWNAGAPAYTEISLFVFGAIG